MEGSINKMLKIYLEEVVGLNVQKITYVDINAEVATVNFIASVDGCEYEEEYRVSLWSLVASIAENI